jgi:Fur family ferric uptake transcriptional regulator
MTIPRYAILGVLSKAPAHLSAEDIYLELHKVHPNVGLTTVYRTLDLLVQMGLVCKFDFGDGRARYELCEGPDRTRHHHHLVCTKCKRVIDYTDFIQEEIDLLKRAKEGLSQKFSFKITDHVVQFHGLCDKCQSRG